MYVGWALVSNLVHTCMYSTDLWKKNNGQIDLWKYCNCLRYIYGGKPSEIDLWKKSYGFRKISWRKAMVWVKFVDVP